MLSIYTQKQKMLIWIIFVFVYSLVFWRMHVNDIEKPNALRLMERGSGHIEKYVYNAAKYFYNYGFANTSGLPVYSNEGEKPTKVSIHVPSLPDILAGVSLTIFNSTNPLILRILPVILSIFLFFFIYFFFGQLLGDPNTAFLSSSIIVLSAYFIGEADGIYYGLYNEVIKFTFCYLLYVYYFKEKKPKYIMGAFILFFIIANISYDAMLMMAIITVGFSWISDRKIFSWQVFLLALAPTLGILLHLYQNSLYLGSLEAAINDFIQITGKRAAGVGAVESKQVNFIKVAKYFFYIMPNRIERFFLIPGWALIIFSYLGLRKLKTENIQLFQIAIVLLLSIFPWNILMFQYNSVHVFHTRNIALFYGLIIGFGIIEYIKVLKIEWDISLLKKTYHSVFVGYVGVIILTQTILTLYLRYGFFYPWADNLALSLGIK